MGGNLLPVGSLPFDLGCIPYFIRTRIGIFAYLVMLSMMVVGFASPVQATAQSRRIVVDSNSGFALYGYDPVAYFTDHAAIRGEREYEHVWQGVSWLFSSRANREVFVANPEVYAPMFGGHGALAMARGYISDSNPNVWAIYRSRLFLFYSYTARAAWAEAVDLHVERAIKNWKTLEANQPR
nr:YHS domain-containing (seleno)protein [uncultured Cohaesibacter sp.]